MFLCSRKPACWCVQVSTQVCTSLNVSVSAWDCGVSPHVCGGLLCLYWQVAIGVVVSLYQRLFLFERQKSCVLSVCLRDSVCPCVLMAECFHAWVGGSECVRGCVMVTRHIRQHWGGSLSRRGWQDSRGCHSDAGQPTVSLHCPQT